MKYIIIIPARGGSKRLPHKNILPLCGKPLIAHTISYAQQYYPNIDVYVSTDDDDIIDVSKNYNVNVIRRSPKLSGDYVTTADVLKDFSLNLEKKGVFYDYLILLQCTSPIRPVDLIQRSIDIVENEHINSLVGVTRLVQKLGKIKNNKFEPFNYIFGQRSQDLEPLYYENGLIYVTNKSLIDKGIIIDENAYPLIIDEKSAQVDIDTLEDFELAESILKNNLQ